MDQEKFLQLQMQMRHNQDDYRNFLNDLDSWSSEMKVKDNEISRKNSKSEKSNGNSNFEIRSRKPKINAYDYRSWDKFDVNAALAEMDENENKREIEEKNEFREKEEENNENGKREEAVLGDREDTGGEIEPVGEREALLGEEIRLEGNSHFKEARFTAAIERYTAAISCDPRSTAARVNRALAFTRIGRRLCAERDCSEALRIDPRCVKALYQRAKCRSASGDASRAIADLSTAINIDPNNTAARALRDRLSSRPQPSIRPGAIQPLYTPPESAGPSTLTSIAIIDVDPRKSAFGTFNNHSQSKESMENQEKSIIDNENRLKSINYDRNRFESELTENQIKSINNQSIIDNMNISSSGTTVDLSQRQTGLQLARVSADERQPLYTPIIDVDPRKSAFGTFNNHSQSKESMENQEKSIIDNENRLQSINYDRNRFESELSENQIKSINNQSIIDNMNISSSSAATVDLNQRQMRQPQTGLQLARVSADERQPLYTPIIDVDPRKSAFGTFNNHSQSKESMENQEKSQKSIIDDENRLKSISYDRNRFESELSENQIKSTNNQSIIDNMNISSSSAATVNLNQGQMRQPQTGLQLARDLARVRADEKQLAVYVSALDRERYARVIGHSLDDRMLLDLFNGLSGALSLGLITPAVFVDSVVCLRERVPRFASTWMMIPGADKCRFESAARSLSSVTSAGDVGDGARLMEQLAPLLR